MVKDVLSLFWLYSKNSFKSRMLFKFDAITSALGLFCREAGNIIVIYLTLLKFNNINGWNINEMMFLFSLLFVTYSLLVIFFAGLRDFSYRIEDGAFDRMIIRPRGVLFQLMSVNSDWIAAMGHGGLGVLLFILSASKVGIVWNLKTVGFYIFTIFGGVLIQGAIFLFFASLNLVLVKVDNLRGLFYWNMKRFAGYPISIFNKVIQTMLIYVIPFAFVNYFPCQYLLRKNDMLQYPAFFMYISPLVGVVLYLLAYAFWKFSFRYYNSTGN
ncbi:MAG: ABC-2 family transporter protein [Bacillota bacterium]|nr:ABC-2 family transporter protein [Bacillota bacterium]